MNAPLPQPLVFHSKRRDPALATRLRSAVSGDVLFDAASRAESLARSDPRTSCFYARRALELTVAWSTNTNPQ